jgi:hypothetical protein
MPKGDQSRGASGFTDNEGKFELTTYSPGDGALPGDYVITVSKFQGNDRPASGAGDMDPKEMAKLMKQHADLVKKSRGAPVTIPAAYADANKSHLKATVIPDMAPVKLKLKKA